MSLLFISLLINSIVQPFAQSTSTFTINVSNKDGDIGFFPDILEAQLGDEVKFVFWPTNHSVAVSSFHQPCRPRAGGSETFFTGFMPVENGTDTLPTFAINITDISNAIWFYCGQARHCQEGMVGVINIPSDLTLDQYRVLASAASDNTVPSQSFNGIVSQESVSSNNISNASASTASSALPTQSNGNQAAGLRLFKILARVTFIGSIVLVLGLNLW
ncbi:Cupredoxin [Penicillium occitanis (nom. inval.)]|nr:hypothetical protein PENOC_098100 [Penicillium occitanis (nom. inval.)]PCG97202.1 Cupredoxin [Penicillium occitanis (nom. inval.)]